MRRQKAVIALVGVSLVSLAALAARQGGILPALAPIAKPGIGVPDPSPTPPGPPGGIGFRVYHVDYQNGDDAASGTKPAAPWKHAPGDPKATANAKAVKLNPGDIVRFRGDSRYLGTINIPASGTPEHPITYTGQGYPAGRAVIDGADPMTMARFCTSAQECAGAPNWQELVIVGFTKPPTSNIRIYDDTYGPLFEAQSPAMPDPFWHDGVADYAHIPLDQAPQVAQGILVHPQLAAEARAAPYPRLLIWIKSNMVLERQITSVSGDTIHFDPTGVVPYDNQDGRAAVLGSINALTRRGDFIISGPGRAVIYPRIGGGRLYIGNGRMAFNLAGRSNVRITGFRFEHGTASPSAGREGVSIMNLGRGGGNITIENNEWFAFSLRNGLGVVQLGQADGMTFRNNSIEEIHSGSGVRLGNHVTNLLFEKNRIRRVGRTGLMLQGVTDAVVRNNIFSNMQGVHGNAMSAYRGNRNVQILSNCAFDATRPIIFEGTKDASFVNDLTIGGNIFITNAEGHSAIYSWGDHVNKVMVEGNVAISPRAGIILAGTNHAITVRHNRAGAIAPSNATEADVYDNSHMTMADVADYALQADTCSGPGYFGPMSISRL